MTRRANATMPRMIQAGIKPWAIDLEVLNPFRHPAANLSGDSRPGRVKILVAKY